MKILGWMALGAVLVPFVVAAVALLRLGGFHAVGDNAAAEMHVRDLGHYAVLLGPYSHGDWSHPGPALYYALVAPYYLTGGNSIGLYVGALAVNAAAVVGMTMIARRHGGTALMLLTLVGCSLFLHAASPAFTRDPWNPYITVLPFGALMFLVWALTCGDVWMLPIAAAVASFCVQSEIGYAGLVIPLFVAGAAYVTFVTWRQVRTNSDSTPRFRSLTRSWIVTACVLAVMWVSPLVDEMTNHPGNLTRIVRYFRHPPDAHHTLMQGCRIIAGQFALRPAWITGTTKVSAFTSEPALLYRSPIPWLLVAFTAGCVFLYRAGRSAELKLAAIVVVGMVLGALSVARTPGPAYAYRLDWSWIIAMIAMIVAADALWQCGSRRIGGFPWLFATTGLVALVVLNSWTAVDAATAGSPQRPTSTVLSELAPEVLAALPSKNREVVVQPTNLGSYDVYKGLVLWLERHGIPARVPEVAVLTFGAHRLQRNDRFRTVVTVATDSTIDVIGGRPGQRLAGIVHAGGHATAAFVSAQP
jgi:uncharacterized membrane protein